MTEKKEHFTPGPWIVRHTEDCRVINIYADEKRGGLKICTMHGSMDTVAQDNAALISAAPDMYEALKGLIDIFSKLNIEVDKPVLDRTPVWRKLCHILCSADEALKKARGEE